MSFFQSVFSNAGKIIDYNRNVKAAEQQQEAQRLAIENAKMRLANEQGQAQTRSDIASFFSNQPDDAVQNPNIMIEAAKMAAKRGYPELASNYIAEAGQLETMARQKNQELANQKAQSLSYASGQAMAYLQNGSPFAAQELVNSAVRAGIPMQSIPSIDSPQFQAFAESVVPMGMAAKDYGNMQRRIEKDQEVADWKDRYLEYLQNKPTNNVAKSSGLPVENIGLPQIAADVMVAPNGKTLEANKKRAAFLQKSTEATIPPTVAMQALKIAETMNGSLVDSQKRAAFLKANHDAIENQVKEALREVDTLKLKGNVAINAGKLMVDGKVVPVTSPIYQSYAKYEALMGAVQREYGTMTMFGKATVFGLRSAQDLVKGSMGEGLKGFLQGVDAEAKASISALKSVMQSQTIAPYLVMIDGAKDKKKAATSLGMDYLSKSEVEAAAKKANMPVERLAVMLVAKGIYPEGLEYNPPVK